MMTLKDFWFNPLFRGHYKPPCFPTHSSIRADFKKFNINAFCILCIFTCLLADPIFTHLLQKHLYYNSLLQKQHPFTTAKEDLHLVNGFEKDDFIGQGQRILFKTDVHLVFSRKVNVSAFTNLVCFPSVFFLLKDERVLFHMLRL